MRNLKKVLSLTLALVMMLGMMTFAGAAEAKKITAADFKDMDKVENKEAVSLLVDLGILNGVKAADGTYTFNPAGNIERGAYAKMIFAVMMNKDNADVYKGSFTGLSDVKGHWAEGFIAYCVSTKIAAGNPDKTFTPNAPIKTVTAAKMLLTGLGYNAKLSHYENDALWSINVMKDAQNAGLLEGVKTAADENLTRDAAAQMIFNALFADQKLAVTEHDMGVEYLKNYVNRYTDDKNQLGRFVFKLGAPITAVVTDNEANTGSGLKGKTSMVGHPTVATKTTLEDLGKSVTYYTFGAPEKVSTFAFPTSKNHVYTIDAAMDADDATKWLSKNGLSISNGTDANGTGLDATLTNYGWAGAQTNNKAALTGIKNAMIATAIDNNGDGVIDVISKITKALTKVTGEVKTKTATDGTVTVYVPGITGNYETVVGAKDLAKGDWATWIKIGDVYNITECATVEGKVTGYKGSGKTGTVYIDGAAYAISSIANTAWDAVSDYTGIELGYKDAAKFWLDDNKNLVFAKKVDATVTYNTAVVLGFDEAGTATTVDNVGTAKLLFPDGTVQNVKVSSFVTTSGAALTPFTKAFGTGGEKDINTYYKMAAYTIDADGKYELVDINQDAEKAVDTILYKRDMMIDNGINPGHANFLTNEHAATTNAKVVGNADTVFLVTTWDGTKVTGYKAYKGIANAPKYVGDGDAADGAIGAVLSADGIAKLVFITGGPSVSVGKDSKYIYTANGAEPSYDGVKKTYTYATGAFVDGVEVKNLVSEVALHAGELREVEINADGVVVAQKASKETFGNAGVKYNNGVIAVNTAITAKYYAYAEDVVIAVIAKDGKSVTTIDPTNIETDGTDTVVLMMNTDSTKVLAMYIQKADPTAPAVVYGIASGANADPSTDMPAANAETVGAVGHKLRIKVTAAAGTTVTSVSVTTAAAPNAPVIKTDVTGTLKNVVVTDDYTLLAGDTGTAGAANTKLVTVVVIYTDGTVTSSATHTLNLKVSG